MATLHIHLDESGNWYFNPKGTKYFVFAAAWTYEPRPLAMALQDLRYRLTRDGLSLDAFHAAPDQQSIRDQVVRAMVDDQGWQFAAIVVEKRKVNPSIREPQRFYPTFAGMVIRFILNGRRREGTDRVLVYTDTLPLDTNAKREAVLKAIKTACAQVLPKGTAHHVYSHRLESNAWLQVADYCCWSVMRKYESEDRRTYDQLRPRLAAFEFDVTAQGDGTVYY